MKNPKQFLTLLLTQWRFAMAQPALCKQAFLASRTSRGDGFTADVIRALICHGGDWRAAAQWLERNRNFDRAKAFRKWAAKIMAPQKRGLLLEWKGGSL